MAFMPIQCRVLEIIHAEAAQALWMSDGPPD